MTLVKIVVTKENGAVQPLNNFPVNSPYKTTRPEAMPIELTKNMNVEEQRRLEFTRS